jgi:hypothetical protein
MTLDARARATALKLLTKFGKSCTLKSTVAGVYDPATASVTPVVTPYPIKAYLDQPNKTELAGGQVVSTDEVAIFAALGLAVEPKLNDTITVDGGDRLVKMVNRVWSGELVALWRCGLAS